MRRIFQSFYKAKRGRAKSKHQINWCVVGSGNPGAEYADSRHNIAWRVLDLLTADAQLPLTHTSDELRTNFIKCTEHRFVGKRLAIGYPSSFVNLIGAPIKSMLNFYGVKPSNLIVVYDDTHLDVGMVRVKQGGSSGNHNGIKSVISALGTEDFIRVRVGVGQPKHPGELKNYVLSAPPDSESEALTTAVQAAADAVKLTIQRGVSEAMQLNRKNRAA